MKTFGYKKYSAEVIKKFVAKSKPITNDKLTIVKGEEEALWVDIWFKYGETNFSIKQSLVMGNLSELVTFFENIINLKGEIALFLDDELISEPLLYRTVAQSRKLCGSWSCYATHSRVSVFVPHTGSRISKTFRYTYATLRIQAHNYSALPACVRFVISNWKIKNNCTNYHFRPSLKAKHVGKNSKTQ